MSEENVTLWSGNKKRNGNPTERCIIESSHVNRTIPVGTKGQVYNNQTLETRTMGVVACILVTELCERLTFYGVSGNLVLFSTSVLQMTSEDAASVQLIFAGTSYLFPVAGGYVADSIAGRFNTILGSSLVYILGLFLLPAASADYKSWFGTSDDGLQYGLSLETKRVYFLCGLALVAIGTGGIKANVGPFGAQQVEKHGRLAVQSFFNWFYWFVNLGALIAYSAVAYIQQDISFSWGYVVPLVSMMLAIVIFVAAKGCYIHTPPGESGLTTAFKVCYQNCSRRSNDKSSNDNSSLKYARVAYGGSYDNEIVDGVMAVLRILPIFSLLLVYAAIYAQMQSTFFLQSERLSVAVGDITIPAAMLNIFNTICILLIVPLVDRVIYPCVAAYGYKFTYLRRMGVGLLFSASSVVVAGVLEIYRKQDLIKSGGITQVLGGETFNSSSVSVLAQIPQFALVGTAEVFTSISALEFAFTQAPPSMQGLLTGLFYAVMGLGNYIATLIIFIVNAASTNEPWFPNELNNGHAEYLFFLLAGFMVVNLFVFIVAARRYKTPSGNSLNEEIILPQEYIDGSDGDRSEECKPLLQSSGHHGYGSETFF